MEVLPRAVASSSVVVATSSPSSGSSQRKMPKSLPFVIPFFRPASALAASILASAPPAALAALNYDDIVKKASQSASESASSFPDLPSIDLPSVNFDGASDFASANPVALLVGVLALAVPFIASRAVAGTTSFGSVSAVDAYEKLADPDQNAQLLDIRGLADVKAEGSPNLKSIRKTVIKVAYSADDDKFVDKVLAKCKIAEDTTLYVLDRFDGNAAVVAKLLANSGFKKAYAVKGGAEGQNGWVAKELPWATPASSFNLDIGGLKGILPDAEGVFEGKANLSTALGVAAAAGVGVVAFSEVETTLQLLGAVALVQIFVKKFLYAKDRKNTIAELKTLLDQKIAPKGFVDEIKDVGRVLYPKESEVQAAIGTGASVLEKKLGVDSVTPQTLGEKAKEKIGEEAEKAGVELPDLEGVTADLKSGAKDLQSNVEAVTSDLQSGAQDLQSKTEEVTSDLQSGAQDLQSKAEDAASDLKSEAEGVTSDVQSKAEEVSSDVQSKAEEVSSNVESNAKAAGADLKEGVKEAESAVESTTESAKPGNGSAAPKLDNSKVVPFFEDERESAQAAFEGDEPNAFEEQVGQDIAQKKLEGITTSGSSDSSS